jgi:hypothetical protein
VFAPWNIVKYNIFGTKDAGPEIFGTENLTSEDMSSIVCTGDYLIINTLKAFTDQYYNDPKINILANCRHNLLGDEQGDISMQNCSFIVGIGKHTAYMMRI